VFPDWFNPKPYIETLAVAVFQRVHCESKVAVAVSREQFGNPGKGMSAVGSWSPKTSVGQQTKRTERVCNELLCVQ
jgi:hypothetical protein